MCDVSIVDELGQRGRGLWQRARDLAQRGKLALGAGFVHSIEI
jgi:hypothetical protein